MSEGERLKGTGFHPWKPRMGAHKENQSPVQSIFSTHTQGNPDGKHVFSTLRLSQGCRDRESRTETVTHSDSGLTPHSQSLYPPCLANKPPPQPAVQEIKT